MIDYGHRWGMGSPPQDTYSVVTHPKRFAPVVTVAHALITHLVDTYDVTVTVDGERTTLDPGPNRARLVFTIDDTDEPWVSAKAGMWALHVFPICSCDACDEDIDDVVSDMEYFVFAVIAGGLSETLSRSSLTITLHDVNDGDLATISRSATQHLKRGERRKARRESALVPPRWLPWTRTHDTTSTGRVLPTPPEHSAAADDLTPFAKDPDDRQAARMAAAAQAALTSEIAPVSSSFIVRDQDIDPAASIDRDTPSANGPGSPDPS